MLTFKTKFISIVLIVLPLLLFAQSSDLDHSKKIQAQLKTLSNLQQAHKGEGLLWAYLRFEDVPTTQQKERIQALGIKLFQYEPDLKWFAAIPVSTAAESLVDVGVNKVWDKPLHRTIDTRIISGSVPDYARHADEIQAIITIAAVEDLSQLKIQLERLGLMLGEGFDPLGIIEVSGSETALKKAAALPFVIYIELPEPPAELEIEDEMVMTRGAFINGYYLLNGVTGDGVTIAVNEGGIVDTLFDPDFKNRLDRNLESGNTSGHKTGVSWRMASAGNINPIHRGEAWGAELMSGGINFNNAAQDSVNIVNNSFGFGCISSTAPNYNAGSALNDFLVYNHSRFMITYSCGNIGGSNCASYGAGPGWGSITGLTKSAKNIFAVGAMNLNDQLTGFSSLGPAMDGRILPDITATGPGGTSHASPNLAGVNALLTEAFRNVNNNQWPNSGLIKGIILNTADDINNPGPDFKTGFGRINAKRAKEVIDQDQFISDMIANNGVNNHSIMVPSGVKQLKVSLYWTDRESTSGNFGKTLVNDMDLRVQQPNTTWVQPWVLNTFPHPDSLELPAVHGTDTLNNVELVTIENPASGSYTVEVSGALIPFGPELYHVIYSFVFDSIAVIFPQGGEGLVPGETRRIRWDAYDSNNPFNIELSSDSGNTWQSVATGINSALRTYTWSIPNISSDNCLIRVSNGIQADTSSTRFTISSVPENLAIAWRCADSAMFTWDSIPDVLGYRVYKLGNKYMDTLGFTMDPYYVLYNLSSSEDEWVSVEAVLQDSGSSRRAIAIKVQPGDQNCIGIDLALTALISPSSTFFPSCFVGDSLNLKIKLQNVGTTSLSNLPIGYQVNGGPIQNDTILVSLGSINQITHTNAAAVVLQSGSNTLKVWCAYPGDNNASNDTLVLTLTQYTSSSSTLPYTQNFDNFVGCSTAWGCESISCNLSQGWLNLVNANGSDSIDWRTHSGATGTGNTGPSGDNTTGNGNYLYLEGSGNGGSGCQWKEAQLHSPCFDLSEANNPELSYWYHAYGSAIGALHVDVLADGQWHLDVAEPVVGNQGNQWFQREADLSAFEGQEIVVRFRGLTGPGWTSDLAIDDINLTSMPNAGFETPYDSFCLGQTVPLMNETSYGSSYIWSILPNTFSYANGNANSINPSLVPNDTGWYDVQLIANNSYGSDTMLIEDLFYVGIFEDPIITANANNQNYCYGDSAVFTVSGIGNTFTFYQNGVPMQSGESKTWTTQVINDGDSIWVEQFINPGCSQESEALQVRIQPDLNTATLWTSEPDLTICEGDTVNFSTWHGLSNYHYFIDQASVQNSPDSLFQTNALNNGASVYCFLEDTFGCTGVTDTLTWTVLAKPMQPSILPLGNDSLEASVMASSYQWFKDTQLLIDTSQSIWAQVSGSYAVIALENGCASMASAPYQHTMIGMDALKPLRLSVYPNPAKDVVVVHLEEASDCMLKLYDPTGRIVRIQNLLNGINKIDTKELASGLYTIQISNGSASIVSKIILEK